MFSHNWTICLTVTGSKLYGTNLPTSDTDVRGVCIPPNSIMLSPFSNFEQHEVGGEEDTVIYGLRKFFQLAYDCNPNIIEILYANQDSLATNEWNIVKRSRSLFISQKLRKTFTGYAISQLERLKRHKKWVDNPLVKPERKDFGLEEMPLFSYTELMAILASPPETIKEEYSLYATKEMRYRQAKGEWDKYDTWKSERNRARYELEQKSGYDTKAGMHLVRLLWEAEELLKTGELIFPLKKAKDLLEIRNGSLTYDEMITLSEDIRNQIDSIPSNLPLSPNVKKLELLYFMALDSKGKTE